MDFIERWFHISPDGGSGLSEVLILAVIVAITLIIVSLKNHFPKNFTENLEQLWKRKSNDRVDN